MRFSIRESEIIFEGKLLYVPKEYSFDFEPQQSSSYSLLIGDINITFDYNLNGRQVWGYSAYGGWINKDLICPTALKGKLIMIDELDDAKRIEGSSDWSTFYDPTTGWICVGNISDDGATAVEFATNTIAVIRNQMITALWLKPDFVC